MSNDCEKCLTLFRGLDAAESRVRALEAELSAMAADRDRWQLVAGIDNQCGRDARAELSALRAMSTEIGLLGCYDSGCVLDVAGAGMRTGGGCKCLTGYQGTPEVNRARRAVAELLRALIKAGSKGDDNGR